MRQAQFETTIATHGQGLVEITPQAQRFVMSTGIATGLLTVYCRHTSASLIIQENADPDVQRDLVAFLRRLVPDGDPLFSHTIEGPDDMAAHIKCALTQTTIGIPIANGKLVLGTWQGLFLFEHRTRPHERRVLLHAVGE